LGTNARARSLIEGMISLAHSIGKQVIVEGVETMEQMEILKGIGCNEVQGFLLGRPRALPQFDETRVDYIAAERSEPIELPA